MNKFSMSAVKTFLICVMFGVAYSPPITAQQEITIPSEAMQDTREIFVHLPENYDENREEGYPVIYMLDAGVKDKMAAALISYLNWAEVMPEVIVIGLKNANRGVDFLPGNYSFEDDGTRYFGNGTKLLAYVKDELIPYVDREYKTSGKNVFAGHSWGGQFVTYALSQSPDLFDAYFITSPSFGLNERWSKETFETLQQALIRAESFPDFVYLSVGESEDVNRLADYHRLSALLQQYLPEQTVVYSEIHGSAVHGSNSAVSLPKALQLYFGEKPSH